MKLTSAMIRGALIKGTVMAAVIMVVVFVFNDGEPLEGLSWFELGGFAWLLSCGIFLLPDSGNGSAIEDGNGGGNGGNNSSFFSNLPPKYEYGLGLIVGAPVFTIFDNQTGRVKVCTWDGGVAEPAKCGPWSPAADPPAPSG